MKTILEIFYVRIFGNQVRYQRKEVSLSRKGSDPDQLIWSRIRQSSDGTHTSEAEEHEFIVHSTSWRYERPGKIVLTYVAYSDELEFKKGKTGTLALSKLGTITKNSRKLRPRTELEKKVVSHAMRHIAFLIQTNSLENYRNAIVPSTVKAFEKLWVTLAGRVL